MLHLTIGAHPRDVSAACGGELLFCGTKPVFRAIIDSRQAQEGDLFVAIPGERTDGHRFLLSAATSGAAAVLIERTDVPLEELRSLNCSVILVANTTDALASFAAAHRAELSALTVGVTGSVGKTTTRQFIYAVLSQALHTHKTDGNFNNELGLPLTLTAMKDDHQAAVLELGMAKRGEISFLSKIARPDIAVITTIGTSHIEHLGSREAIRDAKLEILDGMKEGAPLLLNGDEPLLSGRSDAIYVALHNENAPYRAINLRYTENGMLFDAVTPDGILTDCRTPTLGEHTVLDAMYAIAVGKLCSLSEEQIKAGLASFEGVGMRQNLCRHGELLYVLDYYNASPESIKASLTVTKQLAAYRNGRTVAVLGSVLELGEMSESLHRSIGDFAATLPVDLLFTFGEDAAFIADEAKKKGLSDEKITVFADSSDPSPIVTALQETLSANDCILIKASHGIHMERIADRLLQNH